MKKIYIKITALLICYLIVSSVIAQDERYYHRNFIGGNLSEIPFLDYRLSYEYRLTPSHGFKIEMGYKPATRYFTDATIINLGQKTTGWCYRNTANWYYISLGYRYYINKKKTVYISPELFYKLMTADKIVYSWGIINSETSLNAFDLRSMTTDCIGTNLLIGKRATIRFCKGFHMGFDFFTGLSIRAKLIHTTTYGHIEVSHYHDEGVGIVSIPESDNPDHGTTTFVQGMLQFGVIMFFSWPGNFH
ncbi:MAG: hypothetical protein NTX61_11450 [Bacteroidetes bacterium]|nr:hypothetical protein [Bacteroidota bacterium]